jgi:hypothetical protein
VQVQPAVEAAVDLVAPWQWTEVVTGPEAEVQQGRLVAYRPLLPHTRTAIVIGPPRATMN